ncbi:hypothetical protein GCM10007063_06930 [Lentibacillus kapialis]|uniref:Peptidyl-prolyl cis-trans isomerase n=1 Tax=Lentibacillus kapialis TaxID=340214 RepID=A0A917UUJ1_9BACI|nr:hypothetical protein [Lentibacillus kapialis]GGJ87022.1 hypothetical protein GCM10007063_06930 [Lentibacillus kapialis]
MIVQITGNVTYTITLDPTVWIFDDRKIRLEEAFTEDAQNRDEKDELTNAADRFSQEVYQQNLKPPINKTNKGIPRKEREKILENSYVMPIRDFLSYAEIKQDASNVTLETSNGDDVIPLNTLAESFLLFAIDGKPLKEEGPVQLFYRDGSNRSHPIKGIQKMIVN